MKKFPLYFFVSWAGAMISMAAMNVSGYESIAKAFAYGFGIVGMIAGFVWFVVVIKKGMFPSNK